MKIIIKINNKQEHSKNGGGTNKKVNRKQKNMAEKQIKNIVKFVNMSYIDRYLLSNIVDIRKHCRYRFSL